MGEMYGVGCCAVEAGCLSDLSGDEEDKHDYWELIDSETYFLICLLVFAVLKYRRNARS